MEDIKIDDSLWILMAFQLVDYFAKLANDESLSRYEICKLASDKTLALVKAIFKANGAEISD